MENIAVILLWKSAQKSNGLSSCI